MWWRTLRTRKWSIALRRPAAIVLAAAYGVLDEVHQYFVPGRFLSLTDLAMNLLGALLGGAWAVFRDRHFVAALHPGHMFVSEVSHVLTVRLMADMEERAASKMEKEGISEKQARELLLKESELRKKWFLSVFGLDGMEPGRFDLVINVTQIGPKRAANIIVETARDVKFQPITYSVKAMQDQELAGRVRAALIDAYPDVTVTARSGDISIKTKALKKKEKSTFIRDQVQAMEGVSYVELG